MSIWTIADVWRAGAPVALNVGWTDVAGWVSIAVVLTSAAFFILFLDLLGDLLTGFLVMVVVMRIMGTKRLVVLLRLSFAPTFLFQYLFVSQLGVALPQGFWKE